MVLKNYKYTKSLFLNILRCKNLPTNTNTKKKKKKKKKTKKKNTK